MDRCETGNGDCRIDQARRQGLGASRNVGKTEVK